MGSPCCLAPVPSRPGRSLLAPLRSIPFPCPRDFCAFHAHPLVAPETSVPKQTCLPLRAASVHLTPCQLCTAFKERLLLKRLAAAEACAQDAGNEGKLLLHAVLDVVLEA